MSTLTHWRRQANRYGRDLVRVTPGGKIGLLVVGGLGAFFGYRRYYQPKVGDTVNVKLDTVPALQQSLGIAPGQTIACKVLALLSGDSVSVAPIVGGVQAPTGFTVTKSNVVQNLTPRLF